MIFDIAERLLESPSAEATVLYSRTLRHRAVGRDQSRCERNSQAVCIQTTRWIFGLHLDLQRPANVLQLGDAYLKAISDLQAARIEAVLFGYSIEQRRRKAQDQSGIVLVVYLPARGCKSRDDVDTS